ncbi:uncharacterized protein TNIN_447021 [Trichonephila inaurata madagascariensis]|uniref:Uncharacterized protein n=1 Tax=Trichonephila inaurata madagascariensis TaxID=2747483 RepID=A0A8X6YJ17_9ARAC|nr:uncharacterized protein TNIN_447021 [Trichonephila inaurata madagascariensis]
MKFFVLLLLVGVASASFLEYGRKKSTRGVSDDFEKVKKNLKDNEIYLKKKYVDMEEWVKTIIAKGRNNAPEEVEKLKSFYRELTNSMDFGIESEAFLEMYNGELKDVYKMTRNKILEIGRSEQ